MARKHKPEDIIGKLREAGGSALPNKAITVGARSMAA